MGFTPWGAIAKGIGDLTGSVGKIIEGNRLKKRGKNLKRSEGFDYVDSAFKQNRDLAEQGAYSNRSFNQGVDEANLRKGSATSTYAAGQMGGSAAKKLAIAGNAENTFANRMSKLRQTGRNERLDRVDKLMSTNSTLGAIRSQNESRFWETKYAFENAGRKAIYGGIEGIGKAISSNSSMIPGGFGKASGGGGGGFGGF